MHIIVVPSGEDKKFGAKKLFKEIMAESFLNVEKVIPKVVHTPNPKKPTLTLL